MTDHGEGDRRQRKTSLDDEIRACRRCEDMNEKGVTQAAPAWGSLDSPVAIVGQSLCEQCMERQEPFYEGSGSLLNLIFTSYQPHSLSSIVNCSSYLYRELEIVRPRLAIGLGDDAERVLSFFYPTARKVPWPFSAPSNVRSKTVPRLHFAKHPSWIKRTARRRARRVVRSGPVLATR